MPDSTDARQTTPFAVTLQAIAGGTVAVRLAEELQTLTAAVVETGKKGTLTLQLIVAPIKGSNVSNLVVTASTTVKAPKGQDATPSSVFFVDPSHNLTREDPTQLQMQLPIRIVENTPRIVTA